MNNIQSLIEDIADESGIAPTVEITFNHQGWCARVTDQGQVLLCPAGITWLSSGSHVSIDQAVCALEEIVAKGYRLIETYS